MDGTELYICVCDILDFLVYVRAFQSSQYTYTVLSVSSAFVCPNYYYASRQLWCSVVIQFSSVQSFSHVQLLVSPWTASHQISLSITNSRSILKLMSIALLMPSNYLILLLPLLLLPSIFPSTGVFSNESALRIRWPKYGSFSPSISSSNEYSELISFRTDWCDLLAVQGTLKSLLQHQYSKASEALSFLYGPHVCAWLLGKS